MIPTLRPPMETKFVMQQGPYDQIAQDFHLDNSGEDELVIKFFKSP